MDGQHGDLGRYLKTLKIEYSEKNGMPAVRIRDPRIVKVDRAFVEWPDIAEGNRVCDVYAVQTAYLDQDEPRAEAICRCSDDMCREAFAPRISVAAYREVDPQKFSQKPHFRWVPGDWHSASCEWTLAEIAARHSADAALAPGETEQLREERIRANKGQTQRRSNHVDVFVVRRNAADDFVSEDSTDIGFVRGETLDPSDAPRTLRRLNDRYSGMREGQHDVRSSFLREVISSHERLKASGEAKTTPLRIEGVTRTYYEWFRQVNYYSPATDGDRIWGGGVREIQDAGDHFVLVLYGSIAVGGVSQSPIVTISKAAMARSRRGSALALAIKQKLNREFGYLRVWFYGRLEIRDEPPSVVADYDNNLELLYLAPPA